MQSSAGRHDGRLYLGSLTDRMYGVDMMIGQPVSRLKIAQHFVKQLRGAAVASLDMWLVASLWQ